MEGKRLTAVRERERKYGCLFPLMLCQGLTPLLCVMIPAGWEIPSPRPELKTEGGGGSGDRFGESETPRGLSVSPRIS